MNKLLWIPLLFVVAANAGCLWGRLYNPTGIETFVGYPGICEWVIHRKMPSGSLNESLDAEFEQATANESGKKVVPITATVTDTP
jgi:hypothetical protein